MNIANKLGVAVFVIAGGMVYVAEEFNMPYLIPLALGLFGLFAVLLGLETLVNDEIKMFSRLYSRRENFSGLPARLFGVMLLLFGTGVTLFAVTEWIRPSVAGKYLEGLVGSTQGWGILLITFGFFTLLFGLIRLIAGSGHRPEERSGLVDFGYRARGVVNVLIGIILLVGGVWLMLM